MKKINRIIVILENAGRYYGFRYVRCADGATVEAQISGGESNILNALASGNEGWYTDYFWTTKQVKLSDITPLPYAGSHPDEIRKYVNDRLPKLKLTKSAKLAAALKETNAILVGLSADEVDDPAAGITGWKSIHQRCADNAELLKTV